MKHLLITMLLITATAACTNKSGSSNPAPIVPNTGPAPGVAIPHYPGQPTLSQPGWVVVNPDPEHTMWQYNLNGWLCFYNTTWADVVCNVRGN